MSKIEFSRDKIEGLLETLTQLRPSEIRIYMFFVLTQTPGEWFQITYWDVSRLTGVKSAFAVLRDLVKQGKIEKRRGPSGHAQFRFLDDYR